MRSGKASVGVVPWESGSPGNPWFSALVTEDEALEARIGRWRVRNDRRVLTALDERLSAAAIEMDDRPAARRSRNRRSSSAVQIRFLFLNMAQRKCGSASLVPAHLQT